MSRQQDIARNKLVKDYGIGFVPYKSKEEWPNSLQSIVANVQKLMKQTYNEWREDLHLDKNRPWRTEIRERAEIISQLGLQANGDCAEMTRDWRMRFEPEVFKRFDREVNCRTCTGRLWKSFVEVDPSSNGLLDQQKNRTVCTCNRSGNASSAMHNRIFGYLTDTTIQYDTSLSKKLNKKYEQPDRICGLRRIGRIEDNMFRKDIRNDSGGRTVQMQLRSSLIDSDSICLFPFLVFEAKGKIGQQQNSIDKETAFAVREALFIQKELQNSSKGARQDPDPCLWCISQQGAVWEISLAYLVWKQKGDVGEYGMNVVRLWNGDVSFLDDALRLLLIMDFIFDWARDDYRERIICQLQYLVSTTNTATAATFVPRYAESTIPSITNELVEKYHNIESFMEQSAWVGSRASHTAVYFDDKQTASILQGTANLSISHQEEIRSWSLNVSDGQEGHLEAQLPTSSDSLRNYDSQQCAFRDATFIRSRVIGLFITENNIDLLFRSRNEDYQSRRQLRQIIVKLEGEDMLLLRGDVIAAMEQAWAGYNNDQPEIKNPSEEFFVLLTFSAYIGPDWEQIRELCYLAVSTKALKTLCRLGQRPVEFYWVRRDLELIMSLIQVFLRASISANLSACLYRVSMTPYFSDKPHEDNIFRDNGSLPSCVMFHTGTKRLRDLIWDIYRRHRIGRTEPSTPYLRVSSRLDKQSPFSKTSGARQTGAPWTTYIIADELVLAHNKNPTEIKGPEWSLFLVNGDRSKYLVLSLVFDDAKYRRAYLTYRLGPEPGWQRVWWNHTAEYCWDAEDSWDEEDSWDGISITTIKAKEFAKHLASLLFKGAIKASTEGSDSHSSFCGQSSYYDDGLSRRSSGYESDDIVR
ncbi:hypothetical protein QQS21_011368 [Conoideocrella luteorostrata]|uniref:Uncharacterized protein n=1 Tax=Conoideocrella luteorostrata TaxID=1105319 RepID=A0AAJ0CDD6_9HYPO|nr:hypothetical protein QQS21_011368 [Conoideocrella luteorostrata]